MEKVKIPKNLRIKVGSKKEAEWTKSLRLSEELEIRGEVDLEINKLIIALAKKRIAEEKEKFK